LKKKYEIRFTPSFSKDIKALDRVAQIQVLREICILKTDPYVGKPLRGEWKNVNSLRVGTYRVLYQVKGSKVFLLIVDHRKQVYR
jgi:mRNA interferase RelE/StbE